MNLYYDTIKKYKIFVHFIKFNKIINSINYLYIFNYIFSYNKKIVTNLYHVLRNNYNSSILLVLVS